MSLYDNESKKDSLNHEKLIRRFADTVYVLHMEHWRSIVNIKVQDIQTPKIVLTKNII